MKLGGKFAVLSLLSMIGYGLYRQRGNASPVGHDPERSEHGQPVASPPVPRAPFIPSRQLTVKEALELASYLEATEFGGWFASRGFSAADVVAMWQVESGLDPRAIGDGGKAFGLGQVWAASANEVGFPDVAALLVPEVGALASMRYLKLVYGWMVGSSRSDKPYARDGLKSPTFEHLIWAYNAGIGNYLKGVFPASTRDIHLPRWRQFRSAL